MTTIDDERVAAGALGSKKSCPSPTHSLIHVSWGQAGNRSSSVQQPEATRANSLQSQGPNQLIARDRLEKHIVETSSLEGFDRIGHCMRRVRNDAQRCTDRRGTQSPAYLLA